jgi:type II restriction/modification system DNA methylase subunit YeeA
MTDRAAYFGMTAKKTEPVVEKGDVAVIGGRSFPIAVAKKRKALEDRIKKYGFEQTMEAMAYTWFNRLVAIRFMELHGYLDHGYRVLSHPDGKPTPEILEHAEHVDLPGLKKEVVIDLKLAGNKEGELYRLLLTAQCNALHTAMPFLFEKIDDETELLLPDNLLNSDSLMRKLVGEIEEEDWNEVEIIGWLYQFYISEKKDEVIGKVVASEDIPAATQLFTPNWIVKYLVQNTLGRQWLATYPQSALRQQMEYYIEPAQQTPEVQEQLKAITPTSLNPEELTLLDPACGSGHILVEAYDLFKAIYQERGYRAKDIPALILQKNLFGLEIDDRAAQLAAFALMMKARADDRRIFDSGEMPNVVAFVDSQGMSAADLTDALNSPIYKDDVPSEYLFPEVQEEKDGLFGKKALAEKGHVSQGDIASLLALFENSKTFGSLIQVPPKLAVRLTEIENRLSDVLKHGDLTHASAHVLKPLLQQARLLAKQYDCVVANPPYMGGRGMMPALKSFAKDRFPDAKADLFAMFMKRGLELAKPDAMLSMVTMQAWMFLSSFEDLRASLLSQSTIWSMAHLGPRAFTEISGEIVQVTAFVTRRCVVVEYAAVYKRLIEGTEAEKIVGLTTNAAPTYAARQSDFRAIPGQPIAYWISERMRQCFRDGTPLGRIAPTKVGQNTGDNARFLRRWHEVGFSRIAFGVASGAHAIASRQKWFPYNKGGEFRRWYGNCEYLLNWEDDGREVKEYGVIRNDGKHWSRYIQNLDFMFRPSLTWSFISSSFFAVRCSDAGFLFDVAGSSAFPPDEWRECIAGFLCSSIAFDMMKVLNPTMNFQVGNVAALPILQPQVLARKSEIDPVVREAVQLARTDWDSFETSWEFQTLPVLRDQGTDAPRSAGRTLAQSQAAADAECLDRFQRMKQLEEANNRLFIDACGLQDELSPEVPDDQITLYRPDRAQDIQRLISYAIGCMMGRYSLDKPGLVYAHSGNQGFDPDLYKSFRADDDGIIPLLETDWGIRDDATSRFVEFVGVAWPKDHLEENLKFVADSLGTTTGEQPRDTIRRYLATGFYKHHLSMYKKRPIYWLFSSGKLRAFQCLVYLHRYHDGTLARMRTEYVIPLQGQIASRIDQLDGDKVKATSTSHRKKLQKEQDDLKKQQTELLTFEEKLKHAADQKITLDLDDGVKVNYAKFGDLLAESKAITGGKEEE